MKQAVKELKDSKQFAFWEVHTAAYCDFLK